jgi:hypothetical protein
MSNRFPALNSWQRFLLLLLLILAFGHNALAQCTGSSPTWATTPDQSSVNTCISNASSGDRINVSSGSATWSSVTIPSNKGLSLACPSMSCSITGSGFGYVTINAGSTSVGSVLTGFSFTGGTLNVNTSNGNAAPRIYNNSFTGSGTLVETDGHGPALIDHNTINSQSNAAETFHILGGSVGCTSCWTDDVVPGGPNMLFLENNTWNGPGGGYCQAHESFYGAVFTFRYNLLNGCQIDVHGSGPPSGRWGEWYNNTYNNCCTSSSDFDWRGGSGVYWGNTATNRMNSTDTGLGPLCGSSDICGTYPVQYQFGVGIGGLSYSPVYIWGNATPETSAHVVAPSMVQMGTAPNDPAHCSGMSGSLCNAIVTTTQPATLLRCESAADVAAGCPVSYTYTPYTYPHPSDNCRSTTFGVVSGGCSSSSPPPPAPPSGLTAIVQ